MKITKILRSDIYRDGGSISIAYLCDGNPNIEYSIFFMVNNDYSDFQSRDFDSVHLHSGRHCTYKCPLTGKAIPDYKQSKCDITWNEANTIISELQPLSTTLDSVDYDRYTLMARTVKNKIYSMGKI